MSVINQSGKCLSVKPLIIWKCLEDNNILLYLFLLNFCIVLSHHLLPERLKNRMFELRTHASSLQDKRLYHSGGFHTGGQSKASNNQNQEQDYWRLETYLDHRSRQYPPRDGKQNVNHLLAERLLPADPPDWAKMQRFLKNAPMSSKMFAYPYIVHHLLCHVLENTTIFKFVS